jgi:hypothetical protein
VSTLRQASYYLIILLFEQMNTSLHIFFAWHLHEIEAILPPHTLISFAARFTRQQTRLQTFLFLITQAGYQHGSRCAMISKKASSLLDSMQSSY